MCGECAIREEFTCSALGLSHPRPRIFGESRCATLQLVYVVYRVVVALYFTAMVIYSGVDYKYKEKWFIYLTNWSFFVLTVNALIQAACVLYHYVKARKFAADAPVYESMPWLFKLGWISQNLCLSSAPLVSLLYWGILYDDTYTLGVINVNTHAVNTAYTLIDLLITGVPVRLLHFYFSSIYGVIYTLFSLFYSLGDGTNERGDVYIYSQLNWEDNAAKAVGWGAGLSFVAVPVMHLVSWIIYKIEIAILSCCNCGPNRVTSTEPTERTVISSGHLNKAYDP